MTKIIGEDISKEQRISNLEMAFTEVLRDMSIDFEDDNFTNTPHRVAKMYVNEIFRGLYDDIGKLKLSTFDNKNTYSGIVMVGPIQVKSTCAHHFMPFFGDCYIGYIPEKKLLGLSKFARIVDHFSRKPQTQELLIEEIAKFLKETLQTENIAVLMKCEHTCMSIRGVEEPCADTATASMNGLFMHSDSTKNEFYELVKLQRK